MNGAFANPLKVLSSWYVSSLGSETDFMALITTRQLFI